MKQNEIYILSKRYTYIYISLFIYYFSYISKTKDDKLQLNKNFIGGYWEKILKRLSKPNTLCVPFEMYFKKAKSWLTQEKEKKFFYSKIFCLTQQIICVHLEFLWSCS